MDHVCVVVLLVRAADDLTREHSDRQCCSERPTSRPAPRPLTPHYINSQTGGHPANRSDKQGGGATLLSAAGSQPSARGTGGKFGEAAGRDWRFAAPACRR